MSLYDDSSRARGALLISGAATLLLGCTCGRLGEPSATEPDIETSAQPEPAPSGAANEAEPEAPFTKAAPCELGEPFELASGDAKLLGLWREPDGTIKGVIGSNGDIFLGTVDLATSSFERSLTVTLSRGGVGEQAWRSASGEALLVWRSHPRTEGPRWLRWGEVDRDASPHALHLGVIERGGVRELELPRLPRGHSERWIGPMDDPSASEVVGFFQYREAPGGGVTSAICFVFPSKAFTPADPCALNGGNVDSPPDTVLRLDSGAFVAAEINGLGAALVRDFGEQIQIGRLGTRTNRQGQEVPARIARAHLSPFAPRVARSGDRHVVIWAENSANADGPFEIRVQAFVPPGEPSGEPVTLPVQATGSYGRRSNDPRTEAFFDLDAVADELLLSVATPDVASEAPVSSTFVRVDLALPEPDVLTSPPQTIPLPSTRILPVDPGTVLFWSRVTGHAVIGSCGFSNHRDRL